MLAQGAQTKFKQSHLFELCHVFILCILDVAWLLTYVSLLVLTILFRATFRLHFSTPFVSFVNDWKIKELIGDFGYSPEN